MVVDSEYFSPAKAVWNWRNELSDTRDLFQLMYDAVDNPESLSPPQWGHLYTSVLEFAPDLIIELGRHFGNSTCVFTAAANRIGNCKVVSLCRSTYWYDRTLERLKTVVPEQWFSPLDVRVTDILQVDMQAIISNHSRILILWDAHSHKIAEFMLGYVMPLLKSRQHIIVLHDISDLRYNAGWEYGGKRLWRFGNDDEPTDHGTRVVLGHLSSAVEQVIPIVDFTSRNRLELKSADHSFYTELNEQQVLELSEKTNPFFSRNGHWFWFSLNRQNLEAPIHFPAFNPTAPPLPAPSCSNYTPSVASTEIQSLQAQVRALQAQVHWMEGSKFWKLRSAWLELKQKLGFLRQV